MACQLSNSELLLKYLMRIPFTEHLFLATKYWTGTNIADGLNALTICIEVRLMCRI